MAAPDKNAAWTAGVGVTTVAVAAAVISFEHVRALALRAGETQLTSWLLPVSIDGAIAAAVAVLLADSRAGRRPTALTWLLLGLGLASSLAANIASAHPTASARAVAAWPPMALALGIEVLAGLIRRRSIGTDGHPAAGPRTQVAGRSRAGVSSNGHRPALSSTMAMPTGNPTGRPAAEGANLPARRQQGVSDEAAVAMIRALDEASEDGQASRLEIQKALACGGSRAARLAGLAR